MLLGYNTNGLANLDLVEAIELLASIGYRSVAITMDRGALDPFHSGFERQLHVVGEALNTRQMRSTIETGGRFLLDSTTKHEPTLVTADQQGRGRRVDFLRRAIDTAHVIGSDCVSIWSGAVRDAAPEDEVWDRLIDGLQTVLTYAGDCGVVIGFEPEPDMFIDTMQRYEDLCGRLDTAGVDHSVLRLTLDVGHLHCQGEVPIAGQIRRWADQLVNVHLEDMRTGVHEHLMFGEGEIDFPPVLAALADVEYAGPVHVELSRHSDVGAAAARQAYAFLRPYVTDRQPQTMEESV